MKDIEIVAFDDKYWVKLTEYQRLQLENERLKQQIKRMKYCENCKHSYPKCSNNCPYFNTIEVVE